MKKKVFWAIGIYAGVLTLVALYRFISINRNSDALVFASIAGAFAILGFLIWFDS